MFGRAEQQVELVIIKPKNPIHVRKQTQFQTSLCRCTLKVLTSEDLQQN